MEFLIGVVSMPEKQLFEVIANLVLHSISVWEDMHLYAMTYSAEYNAFWGLLDENLKTKVCRYQRQMREERLPPFTMSHAKYYKSILAQENFERIIGQHWKKQLRTILKDNNFHIVMINLNLELKDNHRYEFKYSEKRPAVTEGNLRISTHVGCTNAGALYNHI